jgi:hypothetical protein
MTLREILERQQEEKENKNMFAFYTDDKDFTIRVNVKGFASIDDFESQYELTESGITNNNKSIPHVRKKE